MDKFLEFLSGFNAQTIIPMTLILWYFFRDLKQEIRMQIKQLETKMDKQSDRADKLYEMFVDLLKDGKKK